MKIEYDIEKAVGRMRSVAELDVTSCRFLRGELQIAYMRGQITGMQDASRISNPRLDQDAQDRDYDDGYHEGRADGLREAKKGESDGCS